MQIHNLLHLYNGYFEQNVWLMLRVLHNLDTNRRNCDKIGFNNKNGSCHAKTKLAVLPLILARVIFNSISNVVSDVVVFVYNGMWLILQNSFHNQLDVSKKTMNYMRDGWLELSPHQLSRDRIFKVIILVLIN